MYLFSFAFLSTSIFSSVVPKESVELRLCCANLELSCCAVLLWDCLWTWFQTCDLFVLCINNKKLTSNVHTTWITNNAGRRCFIYWKCFPPTDYFPKFASLMNTKIIYEHQAFKKYKQFKLEHFFRLTLNFNALAACNNLPVPGQSGIGKAKNVAFR